MDITIIQQAYPHPKRLKEAATVDDYCVGGALCRFYELLPLRRGDAWKYLGFPEDTQLRAWLQEINPLLSRPQASRYAWRLIEANDAGNFKQAWKLADKAVNYHPRRRTV